MKTTYAIIFMICLFLPVVLFGQGMTIQPGMQVTVKGGAQLKVSTGDLVIISVSATATGTGSLVVDDNASSLVTITGVGNKAKVERYLVASQWHLISSPISDGLAGIFLNQWLLPFNESTNSWGSYIINVNTPLTPGTGYLCYSSASQVYTFTGTLNSGTISPTVSYTSSPSYNLTGNPYPSAIDWDAASGWTKTSIGNTIWVYNGALGQYGTYNNPSSTNSVTNVIPIGQGFFVQGTAASPALTMDNRVRVHNTSQQFLKSVVSMISLRLKAVGNNSSDEIVVRFVPESTWNFSPVDDAQKMYGEEWAPQLYALTQGEPVKVSINTLPELSRTLSIPVGLEVGANGNYAITASEMETFPALSTIFLEDLKLNISHDLKANPVYSFVSDTLDNHMRFILHFTNPPYGIEDNKNKPDIHIYSHEQTIYVQNNGTRPLNSKLYVYDPLGKQLYNCDLADDKLSKFNLSLNTGYYFVVVITDDNLYTQKVFISSY